VLLDILRQYLLLFSKPRYLSRQTIPDNSAILDCLAFGFSKLTEAFQRGDDALLPEHQLHKISALDARIAQVARTSKYCQWTDQEWELTHNLAWEVIEGMGWGDQTSN